MAGILDGVAGNLLGKIIEAANHEEIWSIESDLRKLESSVLALKVVLIDAEEKQADEPELIPLLKQINDDFSKAEDLLDELECEYLKWRVRNRRNDGEKVRRVSSCSDFVVHPIRITDQINKIRERLDNIEKTLSRFHLVEEDSEHVRRLKSEMTLRTSITGSQVFARLLRSKREAILSDNHGSVIGREEAKRSIVDKLLTDGDDKEQFRVLSIHGIGGMGKSTLAKLVYNDDKVFDHFDKRMWVCVSEDFDILRVKREILSCSIGEQIIEAPLTDSQLQIRLQRNLFGRKFLLVLDDVGTLNSRRELELKEILKMGANGSKIIVTTRSEPIPNGVAVDPPSSVHKLEKLNEKDSMDLFEYEFEDKDLTENLCEVLEEIMPKCDGVPLAIKCLAGLLSSEISDAEWVNVKDMRQMWEREELNDGGILPALKLSFDLMPSYLKPCFLCFSFLPKDYVFYSYELIQLWMAQGLLHSGNKNLELVGEQYFNELRSRGLLEDVEEHALGYWFKIHDLVHDLAIKLAHKEQENLESSHHLTLVDNSNKDLPPYSSSNIRSLVVPIGGVELKINGDPLEKCFSKFNQLRFLYLCNSSLEEIPTSIDTLKYLTYFDLRGNRRIKRLPESICNLQSLQTLILAFCSELEELPKNIKNMISLRMLWITTKQACLGKDGIGNLPSLRVLAIGGCRNLTQLFEDIDKLNSLQTLIIYDCKSLLSLPEGLKTLTGLCDLAILGCEQLNFTFSLSTLCLKKLILKGFPALALLPPWKNDIDPNLEVLEIGDFPKLKMLPPWFSNLWELRILGISDCPSLVGQMPYDMSNCDKLEELRITFCGSLSKNCMNVSNHLNLEISHVPNIYVDSRRINKQQDGATAQHNHDGETSNGQVGVGPTEAVNQDGAIGHGNVGVGATEAVKHDGAIGDGNVEVGQTEIVKHDGVINDAHTGVGATKAVKHDGAIGDGNVGVGATEAVKHDGAITDGNVGVGPIEGVKHWAPDDGDVGIGQTERVKHDGVINNEHVGAGSTEVAKHDGVIHDKHAGVRGPEGAKHDAATNDEHGGVGQTEGAKHDGAANDKRGGVGRIEGAKHDGDEQIVVTLEGF